MRMFIPALGTRFTLTAEWRTTIEQEDRNWSTIEALRDREGPTCAEQLNEILRSLDTRAAWQLPEEERNALFGERERKIKEFHTRMFDLVLPEGTVLVLDRIYIRKNKDEYDSITFTIDYCPQQRFRTKKLGGPNPRKPRFWVKLEDANRIDFDLA